MINQSFLRRLTGNITVRLRLFLNVLSACGIHFNNKTPTILQTIISRHRQSQEKTPTTELYIFL